MSTVLDAIEIAPLVLRLQPSVDLTDDEFFEFCQINRDWRFERTARGEVLIMAPEGGETGSRSSKLNRQLATWAERDGAGVAFNSSTGFTLPNQAIRSPDVAWVPKARLRNLTPGQKEKFLPLCPDFVVELLSPSDSLPATKKKMEEYMENGARLGWLIDPRRRHVYVYRPGTRVRRLDNPHTVAASPELPGFVLDLRDIWDPGF